MLTDKEIIEGCKLISEFDGMDDCYTEYAIQWDWLMPVVEKIESNGFDTTIFSDEDGNQCIICKAGFSYARNAADVIVPNRLSQRDTKIESVWLSVVEFIKWHNEQQTTP